MRAYDGAVRGHRRVSFKVYLGVPSRHTRHNTYKLLLYISFLFLYLFLSSSYLFFLRG